MTDKTTSASTAPQQHDGATHDRVTVLLPLPVGEGYDYRVPADLALEEGDFVTVPLGRRSVIGVVWGLGGSSDIAETRLKDVIARLDAPPMSAVLRRFVAWVAAYTLTAPGQVLRMAMSVPAALEPPAPAIAYRLAEGFDVEA
ncbi:MAG: primosomal protein N', partial [Alphaproteobacteria bacterium]|nr:primosomal protein N' [Alphaproteobacteria bacterium]